MVDTFFDIFQPPATSGVCRTRTDSYSYYMMIIKTAWRQIDNRQIRSFFVVAAIATKNLSEWKGKREKKGVPDEQVKAKGFVWLPKDGATKIKCGNYQT